MGSGSSAARRCESLRGSSPGSNAPCRRLTAEQQPRGGGQQESSPCPARPAAEPLEELDIDAELDKALAEVRAVCERDPQRRQRRRRASPPLIPSLQLEGTAVTAAHGCTPTLPDSASGEARGSCRQEQHPSSPDTELLKGNPQDVENNNILNKQSPHNTCRITCCARLGPGPQRVSSAPLPEHPSRRKGPRSPAQ